MSRLEPRAIGEPIFFSAHERAVMCADGAAKVWIELAAPGKYEGHPAGAITITPAVIADMKRNFDTDKARNPNRNIPIDFNHASEQDPTSGSIPTDGTPAQGWIHDIRIDSRGHLFGLVEWFEKARGYIRSGEYQGISPAIRFASKDRITGAPIGARLSSAGLTNQPFMDLQRIVASENQPHPDVAPDDPKKRERLEFLAAAAAKFAKKRGIHVKTAHSLLLDVARRVEKERVLDAEGAARALQAELGVTAEEARELVMRASEERTATTMSEPKAYETNPRELALHIARTTGLPLDAAQREVVKMREQNRPEPAGDAAVLARIEAARTSKLNAVRDEAVEYARTHRLPLDEAQRRVVARRSGGR